MSLALGLAGKSIPINGFGLMSMSTSLTHVKQFSRLFVSGYSIPGNVVSDARAFPVLKSAISHGASLWAGATFYGTPEENSLHLANRYFAAHPSDALKITLCVKTGAINMTTMDCSPGYMRRSLENATRILDGKKTVDLFGPARVDPNVPIEDTVRAVAELVKEGKVGGILLSEVSADTIRRAAKVHAISAVEAEVSLWARDIFENGVAETCRELGIVVLAHSPLGKGMLAGNFEDLEALTKKDEFHTMFPRFQGDNFEQNLKLVKAIQKFAIQKRCTAAQLALAWLRSKSGSRDMPVIIPLTGARSEARVEDNCKDVGFTDEETKEIERILEDFPVAGARYPAVHARFLEY